MKLKFTSFATAFAISLTCLPAMADDKPRDAKASKDPMVAVLKDRGDAKSFESTFLSLMIHHHQSGRKMASYAKQKAGNGELKELATKIDSQQGEEIEKMTSWLKQWHDKSPDHSIVPDETKKMEAATSSKLESASGKEFAQLFASKMAEHHASGIAMAKLAQDKAEHQEMKTFAKKMITMQEEEREKLLKLAKE